MDLTKTANTPKVAKRAHFEVLRQKSNDMPRVVCNEESKTGLGFEIGHRQQKCWCEAQRAIDGQPSCMSSLKRIIIATHFLTKLVFWEALNPLNPNLRVNPVSGVTGGTNGGTSRHQSASRRQCYKTCCFNSQESHQNRVPKKQILNIQEFRPGRSAMQWHCGLRLFSKNYIVWYTVQYNASW